MQKEPSLRQQLGAADLQSGCDFSAWRKFDLQPTLACFDILTVGKRHGAFAHTWRVPNCMGLALFYNDYRSSHWRSNDVARSSVPGC
jgi:hypothetical protein